MEIEAAAIEPLLRVAAGGAREHLTREGTRMLSFVGTVFEIFSRLAANHNQTILRG
jgi:hypothetical protein